MHKPKLKTASSLKRWRMQVGMTDFEWVASKFVGKHVYNYELALPSQVSPFDLVMKLGWLILIIVFEECSPRGDSTNGTKFVC